MGLSINEVVIFILYYRAFFRFFVFVFGKGSDIELGNEKVITKKTEGGVKTSKKYCDVIYGRPLLKKTAFLTWPER